MARQYTEYTNAELVEALHEEMAKNQKLRKQLEATSTYAVSTILGLEEELDRNEEARIEIFVENARLQEQLYELEKGLVRAQQLVQQLKAQATAPVTDTAKAETAADTAPPPPPPPRRGSMKELLDRVKH